MSGQLERLLAEVAQPFPWLAMKDGDVVTVCTDDGEHEIVPWNEGAVQVEEVHARLIALAPDLARLLVDAMALVAEHVRKEDAEYEFMGLNEGVCDCDACADSRALLARFAELEQRAGEGQA